MYQQEIYELILKSCKYRINEYQSYHNRLHQEDIRNRKRFKNPPKKIVKVPEEWTESRLYNPFIVYKNAMAISKSIARKLDEGTYKPNKPYEKLIPKPGGGVRKLSIFQIPDECISFLFYSKLLSKNRHRFSSLSYAYRNDRNAHYAIQDLYQEFRSTKRIYISEFDFRDFFNSIDHNFIHECIEQNAFILSPVEREVIQQFLAHFPKGIPLGTSISLFLANVVCWRLDRNLEDQGLRFARYADDTIVWSKSYEKIVKSYFLFENFSKESSVEINEKKSDGINLLGKQLVEYEIRKKHYVEYLGYSVQSNKVSIKVKSVVKIKKHISYLLYRNLIQPFIGYPYKSPNVLPICGDDQMFIIAIMQIRRYMYGNLTDHIIQKYLQGIFKTVKFKGVMSYYPLITDEDQLLMLDKWLISTIMKVLKRRCNEMKRLGENLEGCFPFYLEDHKQLIEECRSKVIFDKPGLASIPSFLRIYSAIQKKLQSEGIDSTMNRNIKNYNY